MISRKRFGECIKQLKKERDRMTRTSSLLKELTGQYCSIADEGYLMDAFVGLMEEMMGDLDCNWISHWVWEMDFGKKGQVQEKDGTTVALKTIDDLYNFLVSNWLEKEFEKFSDTK